ncbi:response regulator [Cohnella sp. GCM10020058]|uniref:response regulator n=1 Tax=Cohnella sp. GCM10020058 TaxID=3317330 RepID=UPI00362E73FB
MKTILVDDERPAIQQLARLLAADGRLQIAGTYTSAADALNHLSNLKADCMFLDIGMPGLSGLEAAGVVRSIDPDIRIVFVTAYADYAVDAFEVQAFDYLLKPVRPARLAKTLDRLYAEYMARPKPPEVSVIEQPNVRCLGRLQVYDRDGKPLRWRTLKTQQLFAALFHAGDWVSRENLLEMLWGEGEADKPVAHLHTSIYQLRKLLKESENGATIEFELESYRLAQAELVADAAQFEQALLRDIPCEESTLPYYENVLLLYRGDYMADLDFEWLRSARTRLADGYMHLSMKTAAYEVSSGRFDQAAARLSAIKERNPFSEELCLLAMEVWCELNDKSAMETCFIDYCAACREELRIEPTLAVRTKYEQLHARFL